jgi:hypothetical protein
MTDQQRQQWKDALAANARRNRGNRTGRRHTGLASVNGIGCIRIAPSAKEPGCEQEPGDARPGRAQDSSTPRRA